MDRLNQLKQYLDFYNNSTATGMYNPRNSYNEQVKGLGWAAQQLGGQDREQMPDFFGGNNNGYQSPQYVQPQNTSSPSPMGGDVTNYLRKLLNGNQPNRLGFTQGVRG